ncbi:cell wall hydrolase [Patescibacteria group bacterium]|nr:cell wall hydrolase [Patescibacteria group bacterium]
MKKKIIKNWYKRKIGKTSHFNWGCCLIFAVVYLLILALVCLIFYWFFEVKKFQDRGFQDRGPEIISMEIPAKEPDFKIALIQRVEDIHIIDQEEIIEAIITEAIGEPEQGIIAVAWVFKNRLDAEMSLGASGLNRENKKDFINRQPQWKKDLVRQIWMDVYMKGEPVDPTGGARYFENVNAFGSPFWIDQVEFVLAVGNHRFFK